MLDNTTPYSKLDDYQGWNASACLHTFQLPNWSCENAAKDITIRLADCEGERNSATMLISRKYSGRGYGRNHHIPSKGVCTTFTATSGDEVIGTLSLTVDSEDGLASDKTFKEELDQFRALPGARICELTKFAFDTNKPSMQLLASLFHIIFIYGSNKFDCSHLFVEVNPRHRRFYQVMLGFQSAGPVKTNDAVGAPSHLLWLKVADIRDNIDQYAGKLDVATHSLYRYFFSREEEVGIYARLVGQSTDKAGELIASHVLAENPIPLDIVNTGPTPSWRALH